MGNFSSCCGSSCPVETILLLDSNGELRQLDLPLKAAELMFEAPGHVVVSMNDIFRAHRIIAMHADDDLLPGHMYWVVLANRINRKVDKEEMDKIKLVFIQKGNSCSGRSKGSSNHIDLKMKKGLENTVVILEASGDSSGGYGQPQPSNGCSRKQWNPALETIMEDN